MSGEGVTLGDIAELRGGVAAGMGNTGTVSVSSSSSSTSVQAAAKKASTAAAAKYMSVLATALLMYQFSPQIAAQWSRVPPLRPLLASFMSPLVTLGPYAGPILFYFIFTFYVALGLTTTPVETISGFTFPLPVACVVNSVAKVSGGCLAFLVSRYLVRAKTPQLNSGILTTDRVRRLSVLSPLKTTILIRFTVLPDLVKNWLLSTLPISFPTFLFGTIIHGVPYSILWTLLGSNMSDVTAKISLTGWLKVLVTVGMGFGVIGSPVWIRKELKNV
jgi:uncharacterized membrane protein YdjX (TVP38/TMEM64 family)